MKASVLLFVLVTSVIDVPTPMVLQNGSSTVSSKDKRIGWKADWSMETVEVRGKRAVRFTEKGAGRLSDYSGEVRWFTVTSPHDWVRYQGPENGPGTPDVVMELSSTGH